MVLARMTRTWKEALFIVQPETLLRWHRALFRCVLEAQITGTCEKAEAFARDDQPDQRDGGKQPTLGSRAHSWRVAQTGHSE